MFWVLISFTSQTTHNMENYPLIIINTHLICFSVCWTSAWPCSFHAWLQIAVWIPLRLDFLQTQMSQIMRLWYLPHRRPAKAQASLHICMKYGSRRRAQPNYQAYIPTGLLRMRIWRMRLPRMKSTSIPCDGSNGISLHIAFTFTLSLSWYIWNTDKRQ